MAKKANAHETFVRNYEGFNALKGMYANLTSDSARADPRVETKARGDLVGKVRELLGDPAYPLDMYAPEGEFKPHVAHAFTHVQSNRDNQFSNHLKEIVADAPADGFRDSERVLTYTGPLSDKKKYEGATKAHKRYQEAQQKLGALESAEDERERKGLEAKFAKDLIAQETGRFAENLKKSGPASDEKVIKAFATFAGNYAVGKRGVAVYLADEMNKAKKEFTDAISGDNLEQYGRENALATAQKVGEKDREAAMATIYQLAAPKKKK